MATDTRARKPCGIRRILHDSLYTRGYPQKANLRRKSLHSSSLSAILRPLHRHRSAPTRRIPPSRCALMRLGSFLVTSLLLCFLASPLSAQLPPPKTDPLAKQSAAAQACSATEASCAEAAAKIMPQVMGPSPMEENLRRLTDEIGGRVTGSPEMAKAVDWAVAAFRASGIDVHTEKYTLPVTWSEGDTRSGTSRPGEISRPSGRRRLVAADAAGRYRGQSHRRRARDAEMISSARAVPSKARSFSSPARSAPRGPIFSTSTRLPPAIIDRAVKGGAAAILLDGSARAPAFVPAHQHRR